MENFKKIVLDIRAVNLTVFDKLVEDYVDKAIVSLRNTLDKHPILAEFEALSVPITEIDFNNATVSVDEDAFFDYFDEITKSFLLATDTSYEFFDSKIDGKLLKPFIQRLSSRGFSCYYKGDEKYLYPVLKL